MEPDVPPLKRLKRLHPLEGGSGRVWVVEDPLHPERPLALEKLVEDRGADAEQLRRAFAARRLLRYPGLVEVYDLDTSDEDDSPFVTRDLVEGDNVVELPEHEGRGLLTALAAETLRALAFLHAFGRVHGRLSPDALRIRARASHGCRVVLLDVGPSLLDAEASERSEPPEVLLPYTAPELFDVWRPTPLSDLYALGATLFEAVHRRTPFRIVKDDLAAFVATVRTGTRSRPSVPEGFPLGLTSWIEELLAPDPAHRPAGAVEALIRLNAACGTEYPVETPDGRAARLSSGPPPGREEEAQRLWRLLETPDGPGLSWLCGPPGSGKRRFFRWLAGEGAARGWTVVALPDRTGFEAAEAAPGKMLELLIERLDRLGANRPTLVLAEATGCDDNRLVDLARRLTRRGNPPNLRVVAAGGVSAAAEQARSSLSTEGRASRIDLGPLGGDAMRALTLRATGTRRLPRGLLRRLVERSAGLAGAAASWLVYGGGEEPGTQGEPGEKGAALLETWAVKGPAQRARALGRRLIGEPDRRKPSGVTPVVRRGAETGDGDSPVVRRLLALYDVTRALNSEDDPEALLASIVDMALEVVGAERGMILLRDEETGVFGVRVARNLERETVEDAGAFSSHVVAEAGTGRSVLALDASRDDRFRNLKSVSLYGIHSLICVPLRSRGTIAGAVYLDNRTEGRLFNQEDLRFLEAFADQAALALENARARADLARENARLQTVAEARARFENIVGASEPMQRVFDLIEKFAASDLPVLILGESGTGKELVARAIHFNGVRRKRAFVTENCAAIPESLLQSELFGHVRGAFTGADRDRAGLFEQADGGTLFLDEIGDMSPGMQAQLLRALQQGEVRRVGGERTHRVDVRVLAATHRDLSRETGGGRFREDLLYRLQVLTVELPPLRERKGDLPLLVEFFMQRIAEARGRSASQVAPEILELFAEYSWPGNVRQLESALQRLSLLAGDGPIDARTLQSDPSLFRTLRGGRPPDSAPLSLEQSERERIVQALGSVQGNRARAARLLGISRATIYRKIKELGL